MNIYIYLQEKKTMLRISDKGWCNQTMQTRRHKSIIRALTLSFVTSRWATWGFLCGLSNARFQLE